MRRTQLMTRAALDERRVAVARLVAQGLSTEIICQRIGCGRDLVRQVRESAKEKK